MSAHDNRLVGTRTIDSTYVVLAFRPALPRQFPVLYPMRLVSRGPEATMAVGFVILVIPLEPHDLALSLEREHVRGDAVEEPAIVADDDNTARELQQGLFERP